MISTGSGSRQEQSTHCPPRALPLVMLISAKPEPCQGSHPCREVQLPHHDLGDPSPPSLGLANARSWSARQTDAPVTQSRSCSSFPRSYARLRKQARLNKPVCLSGGKLLAVIQKSLQPSLPKQQVTPALHSRGFLSKEESSDFAPWWVHSVTRRDEGRIFVHVLISSTGTCCR